MQRFFEVGKNVLLVIWRQLPAIVAFAVLFIIIATYLDKARVQSAPASDFVNYSSFNVPNARTGEDVYFTVCRQHDENYRYDGNLQVLIYKNSDPKSKPAQVYSKDLSGQFRDPECENKVLKAKDYNHDPGTYKMSFCITFPVRYNLTKTACRESNIYKIYAQPSDTESQIDFYEKQIDILKGQLEDSSVDKPSDLKAETQSSDTSGSSSSSGTSRTTTNNTTNNNTTNNNTTTNTPTRCVANVPMLLQVGCR